MFKPNDVFLCLQLDPQMLQGKDWQRTVIPMNGVSISTSAPLLQS